MKPGRATPSSPWWGGFPSSLPALAFTLLPPPSRQHPFSHLLVRVWLGMARGGEVPLQGGQRPPTLWRDTHTCSFTPCPSPFTSSPHSPAPASHCPSLCPLAGCHGGCGLQAGGWPTFVFQAAVGLIALVHAVMEAVTDEAQVEAEPLVAEVLIPGTALCSAGRDGQAGSGNPTGHPPLPQCPGRYGRPPRCYPLPVCSEESWQCLGVGVLTLTGSHGTVVGAEAWGAHAAVRDKGDVQVVGVGVEGRGGHVAAKPGGTTRGDTAHPRRGCPLPTAPPRSPSGRGPTSLSPPEPVQDPCCQPPALHRAPHGQRGRRQCPPR